MITKTSRKTVPWGGFEGGLAGWRPATLITAIIDIIIVVIDTIITVVITATIVVFIIIIITAGGH